MVSPVVSPSPPMRRSRSQAANPLRLRSLRVLRTLCRHSGPLAVGLQSQMTPTSQYSGNHDAPSY